MNPEIEKVLSGESDGCIVQGDSVGVLPTIPDASSVLVLTDPPYGIAYNREKTPQGKHVHSNRKQVAIVEGDDAPFDPSPLLRFRNLILWGANCYASKLPNNPVWLAWDKVTRNGLKLRIAEIELAWTNCVGRPRCFRYLWSGAYREDERGDSFHPTQKPIALMQWCIGIARPEPKVILDPYCGAGSTCIAAKQLGRKYIGIEINKGYCDIARDRLLQLDGKRLGKLHKHPGFFDE